MKMPAVLREAFERAADEDRFWAENYADLLARYPETMVAVQDRRVIAAEPTLALLLQTLRSRGIDPRDVWIQWVSESMARLVL